MSDDGWVVDPVFRVRHRFWREGETQHVETWVEPGGGVTPHVHPAMEEIFVVHEGRCQFLSGFRWVEAGPEDGEIVVPKGTRHAFRNRGDVPARIACRATPASSLQAFLEDAAGMSRAGKLLPIGLPKPTGILEAAVLIDAYDEMVHMRFPAPPRPVQKLVFGPLARVARRRGLQAGQLKALA
jgi:mannose-6-phosphate isomerase-like protein (cupin superfamily)